MRFSFIAATLLAAILPASADSIFFVAPTSPVNGAFDVEVKVQDPFAGRDPSTDGILTYGFDFTFNPAVLQFLGADSGPLFDPPTPVPGTDVFGAASGIGIFPPVTDPLEIAILHFATVGVGTTNIVMSTDLANAFQGLQFFNTPFAESIAGSLQVTAVPEPSAILLMGFGLLALMGFVKRRLA